MFAVKGSSYITHMLRGRDVRVPPANFFASGLFSLGRKLGPVLRQFPTSFGYDAERVDALLA